MFAGEDVQEALARMNDMLNKEDDEDEEIPFDLAAYQLLDHRGPIESFRLMMPDLFEGFTAVLPTVIATFTKEHGIYLWYENMMNKDRQFMCAHIFKHNR